ncbi:transmembrane protein 248 [Elysia marginata]|uniref:Transmembrane protein 248 n=1 Tax=Elysia marginata TaxID=1093978 RepID=A0AAV4HVF5_9GAST|nr:transmembrane protein 248 [Elysia marginata]
MALIIVENLRGFFNSRPPLVLFMVCLASFAIALITFAYLVRIKDMPNPDVSEDWNTILTKFSGLEFCVNSGTTVPGTAQPALNNSSNSPATPGKLKIGDQHPADMLQDIHDSIKGGTILGSGNEKDTSVPATLIPSEAPESRITKRDVDTATGGLRSTIQASGTTANLAQNSTSVTIPLNMEIAPNTELRALSLHLVHLIAEVSGKMLKLNGPAQHKSMQISMRFPANLSRDTCKEWDGKECTLYVINTCVTFSGPALVFPPTQRPASSAVCQQNRFAADGYYLRNMTATTLTVSGSWCSGGSRLTAEFSFDEALTVMLSQQDRSIINLHLMRTSYFLFVMVITLFCYAMIRGRPAKAKAVHIPYEKVMTSGP